MMIHEVQRGVAQLKHTSALLAGGGCRRESRRLLQLEVPAAGRACGRWYRARRGRLGGGSLMGMGVNDGRRRSQAAGVLPTACEWLSDDGALWRFGARLVPACAGMTEGARGWWRETGMVEGEWRGRSGGGTTGGVGLKASTPHLTSPLRGGRDELGRRCGCGGGATLRLAGVLPRVCG